jgi:ribosome-associated protein
MLYSACLRPRHCNLRRTSLPDPAIFAQAIIDLLSDKQASNIVLLELSRVSSLADFFVIATAGSTRQLDALASALDEELDRSFPRLRRREGTADSGWILLDFGEVVVHLFSAEERAFYDLEGLWRRSVPIVRFT